LRLFLLRHSIAEARVTTDFDRHLSAEGHRKVEHLVEVLLGQDFAPGAIVHSPLIRSKQTAQAFARRLPQVPMVELAEVMAAKPSLLQLLGGAGWKAPLIVGHNPSISRLASQLCGENKVLSFQTCSFAEFELDALPPSECRLVRWLPTPPGYASSP
jgi:phosphohistidine phosphatase